MMHTGGIYAITSEESSTDSLLDKATRVLAGGIACLQYRDKSASAELRRHRAEVLRGLCERHATPLVINDDLDLARAVGATGVHLGRDEIERLPEARRAIPRLLVGVSCYDSLGLASEAVRNGADYVAFGSVFPSVTKPNAVHCGLDVLRKARSLLDVPIVAIGGITPENGGEALRAGANLVAVISGLFDVPDIETELLRYRALFC